MECQTEELRDKIYTWDSRNSAPNYEYDLITKRWKSGPQLHHAPEIFVHDKPTVEYCGYLPLINLTDLQKKEISMGVDELCKLVSNKVYETDAIKMIFSLFGKAEFDASNSYFCSEMVARAYQQFFILDPSISASNFTPQSYVDEKYMKQYFREGVSFGNLIKFNV
jgi:hypothetical protein